MNTYQIKNITILGAGKLGQAIANGLVHSEIFDPMNITLTCRNNSSLKAFSERKYLITSDNTAAVKNADLILLTVGPKDIEFVLKEIRDSLDMEKQILASTVTGVSIERISKMIEGKIPIVRIMPNTAVAICESMTCLSAEQKHLGSLKTVREVFDHLGETMAISEELMAPATALCAAGLAFFLRSIRAASQGGIEIGFHAEEAIFLAAQTAKGASSLMMESEKHPESEIDKVTTPRGITIAGLNEMEHQGFSSAMIKAIVTSANKIERLLDK
ncbi:MAG: pyrroline-5-carboxylate reductase [Fidelibacterota bacterium]